MTLRDEINIKKNQKRNKSQPVLIMNTKTEIPITYIKKEQIRIDYYYQLSKAKKQDDIKIVTNLESGFGVLPEETKTLINTAYLRVLLTGSLIENVEGYNNRVVLFLKKPEPGFDVINFFQRVKSFKHKNLINYKYENNKESGLKIYFKTLNFFPSLKLLFSFIKTIKNFYR